VFKNLFGIARVWLTGNVSTISRIYFKPISSEGNFDEATVNFDIVNDEIAFPPNGTSGVTMSSYTGQSYTVVFNPRLTLTSTPIAIDFILPPVTFSAGVKIGFYTGNYEAAPARMSTGAITIERGKITNLGTLDFTTVFAGSNIYWDAGHLTFTDENLQDEFGVTNNNSQYYQGVMFKLGSLIGIDPSASWNTTGTLLYMPDLTTPSSNWSAVTPDPDTGHPGWSGTAFTDVPYEHTVAGSSNYLYENNLGNSFTGYIGDICKFITTTTRCPAGNWRMPTATEFYYSEISNSRTNYTRSPATGGFSAVTGTADGKYQITSGYILNILPSQPFFPASGYWSGGTFVSPGVKGYYLTSSIQSAGSINMLYLDDTFMFMGPSVASIYATPVRCVRDN
jgi:hypothetical protein